MFEQRKDNRKWVTNYTYPCDEQNGFHRCVCGNNKLRIACHTYEDQSHGYMITCTDCGRTLEVDGTENDLRHSWNQYNNGTCESTYKLTKVPETVTIYLKPEDNVNDALKKEIWKQIKVERVSGNQKQEMLKKQNQKILYYTKEDIQDVLQNMLDDADTTPNNPRLKIAHDDLKQRLAEENAELIWILIQNNSCGMPYRTSRFADMCRSGAFTDDDGRGYYVDEQLKETEISVRLQYEKIIENQKKYPWILWYNR